MLQLPCSMVLRTEAVIKMSPAQRSVEAQLLDKLFQVATWTTHMRMSKHHAVHQSILPATHASKYISISCICIASQGQRQRQHGEQPHAAQDGSAGGDAGNELAPPVGNQLAAPVGNHEGRITWTAEGRQLQCYTTILGRAVSLGGVFADGMADGQRLLNG
jgi:hypothetical protein